MGAYAQQYTTMDESREQGFVTTQSPPTCGQSAGGCGRLQSPRLLITLCVASSPSRRPKL